MDNTIETLLCYELQRYYIIQGNSTPPIKLY